MKTAKPKQKVNVAPNFKSLLEQLGASIAAVVEHPDCPALLHSSFIGLMCDVSNEAIAKHGVKHTAAEARLLLPVCIGMLTDAAS